MVRNRNQKMVPRDKLAACMTCPLCNLILREATTVTELLHSFCKECIHEKIKSEDLTSCPVCNTDLGCAPLDKLRSDHNLQDLRNKLFPPKPKKEKQKTKAVEAEAATSLPSELSLASLVISPPRASGRKSIPQRFLAHNKAADPPSTNSPSPEHKKQNFFTGESSTKMSAKDTECNAGEEQGNNDMWKHLACLVDAATDQTTHDQAVDSQGTVAKSVMPSDQHAGDTETHVAAAKMEQGGGSAPSGSEKSRKQKGGRPKRAIGGAEELNLNIPAQAVVDDGNNKHSYRANPIWFSLVPSTDQKGDAPLSQIPSRYLRVKDGSLPVSYIQKYIVLKLGLASESEVEILLEGRAMDPTLQLQNLVGMWLSTKPASQRMRATVDKLAEEFMMNLSYARKAPAP